MAKYVSLDNLTRYDSKIKELLSNSIADFITKSVNDLTNYYTKSQTYTQAEVNSLIGGISSVNFIVVEELPEEDISTSTIYLVPNTSSENGNVYDEYIYVSDGATPTPTYSWEKIGSTETDLSNYVTTTDLNTALASYTTTSDLTTLLSGKQDALVSGTNIKTINNTSILGSGNINVAGGTGAAINSYKAANFSSSTPFIFEDADPGFSTYVYATTMYFKLNSESASSISTSNIQNSGYLYIPKKVVPSELNDNDIIGMFLFLKTDTGSISLQAVKIRYSISSTSGISIDGGVFSPEVSGIVTTTGNQTISGTKIFKNGISCASALYPTNNDYLVNKGYVDAKVGGAKVNLISGYIYLNSTDPGIYQSTYHDTNGIKLYSNNSKYLYVKPFDDKIIVYKKLDSISSGTCVASFVDDNGVLNYVWYDTSSTNLLSVSSNNQTVTGLLPKVYQSLPTEASNGYKHTLALIPRLDTTGGIYFDEYVYIYGMTGVPSNVLWQQINVSSGGGGGGGSDSFVVINCPIYDLFSQYSHGSSYANIYSNNLTAEQIALFDSMSTAADAGKIVIISDLYTDQYSGTTQYLYVFDGMSNYNSSYQYVFKSMAVTSSGGINSASFSRTDYNYGYTKLYNSLNYTPSGGNTGSYFDLNYDYNSYTSSKSLNNVYISMISGGGSSSSASSTSYIIDIEQNYKTPYLPKSPCNPATKSYVDGKTDGKTKVYNIDLVPCASLSYDKLLQIEQYGNYLFKYDSTTRKFSNTNQGIADGICAMIVKFPKELYGKTVTLNYQDSSSSSYAFVSIKRFYKNTSSSQWSSTSIKSTATKDSSVRTSSISISNNQNVYLYIEYVNSGINTNSSYTNTLEFWFTYPNTISITNQYTALQNYYCKLLLDDIYINDYFVNGKFSRNYIVNVNYPEIESDELKAAYQLLGLEVSRCGGTYIQFKKYINGQSQNARFSYNNSTSTGSFIGSSVPMANDFSSKFVKDINDSDNDIDLDSAVLGRYHISDSNLTLSSSYYDDRVLLTSTKNTELDILMTTTTARALETNGPLAKITYPLEISGGNLVQPCTEVYINFSTNKLYTQYNDFTLLNITSLADVATFLGINEYSNSSTYAVGDYCFIKASSSGYDTVTIYKCKTAVTVAESFDSTKWDVKTYNQYITDAVGNGGMTILSYGISTWNDFITAYNDNKIVYCRASSNANPATGSQTRMAFMAYVSNATSPTNVEFQYYRSVSSKSASQQCDQVLVYKLTNANGGTWTVETRETNAKIVAGTGLTSTYSSGSLILNTDFTTFSGYDSSKTQVLKNVRGTLTWVDE